MATGEGPLKAKQYEVYLNNHIDTLRSFIQPMCYEYPTPKPKADNKNYDMVLLKKYIVILTEINVQGYHIYLPQLFNNFINFAQDHKEINLADSKIQRILRNGIIP